MQTLNGYIEVKRTEKESAIITNDHVVLEVMNVGEDAKVKVGDKIIYEGRKIEKNIDGEVKHFILEDDIIAVI